MGRGQQIRPLSAVDDGHRHGPGGAWEDINYINNVDM
jgi:hypothetical protein